MQQYLIKLTYFKPSGKFYGEGEYWTTQVFMMDVFEEVKQKREDGMLPGMYRGEEFTIHVGHVDHPNGYPALIHPKAPILWDPISCCFM